MKRLISTLLVVLLLVGMVSGCSSEKEIKIGFNTQLTGPDSYIGQAAKIALEERVEEINEAGGIGGYKIKLITYDSRSEIPDAVAVAKRLLEQDKVLAMIGPEWTGAAVPIAQIATDSKIPVIATTASNVTVTVDDNGNVYPYMFRTCFIDPYQGYALADYAYVDMGLRKVASLTDISGAYSVGIQKYFKDHFEELGGEIVAEEGYQANDQEFRAQLSKIDQTDAEAILVPTATYRDIALIAKQGSALNMDVTYLGVDGWVAEELLQMAGPELEGSVLTSGVSSEQPEFAEFNKAFEEKHKLKPNVYAYYALDALEMIVYGANESLKANNEITSEGVRDAIENMKDVQLFTSKMTMEPDTHNPHNKPVLIIQIKDSKWHQLKIFQPEN
jgi:branched-chain amino acid transport system substrate-binding protein